MFSRTARLSIILTIASMRLPALLPAGFTDNNLFSVGSPTALAFTPDGRLLITTQGGSLRIYQSGALLATPAAQFGSGGFPALCGNSERGLLGVAVDPAFATNQYIYLFYTFNKFGICPTGQPAATNNPVNRVSRFILPAGNVISAASEKILLDNLPTPNGNHNGGDIHFGKDGYLYVSVGDGGCQLTSPYGCQNQNANARRQDIPSGKILRITADGSIPATNPWVGLAGARVCGDPAGVPPGAGPCSETYEWGHRNPFRIAMDGNSATTRFFINDVGGNNWEEIDLNQSGADFGWNVREGHCLTGSYSTCSPVNPPSAGMTDPLYDYPHTLVRNGINCTSITGGAFIPNGVWPAAYDGGYLFSDYVCGNIFQLSTGPSYTAIDFATALGGGSAVDLRFGPSVAAGGQSLYYTTYAGGGQVHRIDYTGSANRAPVAVIGATPAYGNLPLLVSLNPAGSTDADNDPITCDWDYGDGAILNGQPCSGTTHNYTVAGTYFAQLIVRDNRGGVSSPATVRIDAGNNPPVPVIIAPAASYQFRVGESLSLQGTATDPEDGTLANFALSWTVLLHHVSAATPGAGHTHPFLPPTPGNNVPLSAPAPEDLDAAPGSYLELQLTATDSKGLARTVTQNLDPHKVNAAFATVPATGFVLTVNGLDYSPQSFVSWEGYILNLDAPNQTVGALNYAFLRWSDGGAKTHSVVTPDTPISLTARFACTPTAAPANLRLSKGAGAILNFSWLAGTGACAAQTRIYAASVVTPTGAGLFPLDPPYGAVGITAAAAFSYAPVAGSLFYLATTVDGAGNDGPAGAYGEP